MRETPTRRRLLQTTGAVGVAGLAGCTQFTNDDDATEDDDVEPEPEPETEPEEEPDIDPADGIVAALDLDEDAEAELMELNEELSEQVQAEEIAPEEAQAELQAAQSDLIADAVSAFETDAEAMDGIVVEGTIPEMGAVLLDAEDSPAISLLSDGNVAALLPGIEFEEMQAAQEQPMQPEP